ncbi:MAG: PD-(D/E)XK nuclease family protein [Gemmatimonadales bacterium]
MHPTLAQLQELSRAHPTSRKLLVCPSLNWGREWLRVLARQEGAWVGWEPMTLRALAGELALVPLEMADQRVATDVALEVVVGAATSVALAAGQVRGPLRDLASTGGTRQAIVDAVLELRSAGISPDELCTVATGPTVASLAAILECYLEELATRQLADPARVFEMALEHFAIEAPQVLPAVVVLAPGLSPRGLPAQLAQRLAAHGGIPLASAGAAYPAAPAVPGLACFRAATPSDELREALRRAAEHGWPDDQVELVTTDPDAHGVALDALCRSTGARATMLQGVPLTRTRIGRALERWLAWLESELLADHIREALETGDLAGPPDGPDANTLARELRDLQIGWGRESWQSARVRLNGPGWILKWLRRHTPEDASADEKARRRQEAEHLVAGLRWLLDTVLAHAPPVPERGDAEPVRTSLHRLAIAALNWVKLVPIEGAADRRTVDRLIRRLKELAAEPSGELPFGAALASLRHAIADLRAWTDTAPEQQPWASTGGHLHLTDLAHAGCSGRPHLFLLGLDADRVGGGSTGNALLPDALRHRLGPAQLATTDDRRAERATLVAAALATAAARSVEGSCTISWSIASDLSGRKAAPAPAVLEALRAARQEPEFSFDNLRTLVGHPACAVPGLGSALLDARDLYLAALVDTDGRLLDGTGLVRTNWPHLVDTSLSLGARVADAVPDPFRRAGRPFSPTSLERLSRCPLSWFYRYELDLVPIEDPEYDRERWLDPLSRGQLLHRILDRAGGQFRDRQFGLDGAGIRAELLAIVDEACDDWRISAPVPSEVIFRAERDALRESALIWLEMERESALERHAPRWLEFERWLEGPAALFRLPDGRALPVVGRVDRVDEFPDQRLRAVDYKSGRPERYRLDPKLGPLRGGRLLQPAIYAAAVSALHQDRAVEFEYHFPTPEGLAGRLSFNGSVIPQAGAIITGLMDQLARGEFIPTTDPNDCGWCEYRDICRVHTSDYGKVEDSPRARDAAAAAATDPAFAAMNARRTPEDR